MIEVITQCDVYHVYDLSIDLVLRVFVEGFSVTCEFYESYSFFISDLPFGIVWKRY